MILHTSYTTTWTEEEWLAGRRGKPPTSIDDYARICRVCR